MKTCFALQPREKMLKYLGYFLVLGTFNVLGATPTAPVAPPPAPEGPFLKPAPEFSQWTIAFQYPQDVSLGDKTPVPLEPSLPRKVLVTKTKNIIHQEIVNIGGKSTDSWQIGQTVYVKLPGQTFWGVYDSAFRADNQGANPLYLPLPSGCFRDLDFLTPETFAGETKAGSKKLLTFIAPGQPKAETPPKNASQPVIASITMAQVDEATRLPFTHSIQGSEERTYVFLPPPSAMLQLPPALVEQIKDVEAHRARYHGAAKGE